MKKTLCFIIAILLFFFSADTVFAEETMDHIDSVDTPEGVDNVPPTGDMGFDQDMIGSDSDQSLTSLPDNLQTENAKKELVNLMMNELVNLQNESKKINGFIVTANICREEAKKENKETEMPSEIAEYMKANGLVFDTTGNDLFFNSEEWNKVIKLLQDHQEKLVDESQQKMKAIQDYMENIDPYRWQAENRADSNHTNYGPARGQSMYGDSEAGLAVTGLVVGFFLGCVITLAVQKSRGKKDKA